MLIALDTGPLGDIVNPDNTTATRAIRGWMSSHTDRGNKFLLPEIADYEIRRNDVLETMIAPFGPSKSAAALYLLDQLKNTIEYLPITTDGMIKAASLWAETQKGKSSISPKLDGDAILAGHVIVRSASTDQIVIATMNVRDFVVMNFSTPLVTAQDWDKI